MKEGWIFKNLTELLAKILDEALLQHSFFVEMRKCVADISIGVLSLGSVFDQLLIFLKLIQVKF